MRRAASAKERRRDAPARYPRALKEPCLGPVDPPAREDLLRALALPE